MSDDDDAIPGLLLNLDEAIRIFHALDASVTVLERSGLAPGLRDELATVIRIIVHRLGLDSGGAE